MEDLNVHQLEREVKFLHEQLWHSQEAMRRLLLELTKHLGTQGAESIGSLLTEWVQITNDIDNEYKGGLI